MVRKVLTTSKTSSKRILNFPFGNPSYDICNNKEALSKCLITQLLQREKNNLEEEKQRKKLASLKKKNETSRNDAGKEMLSKQESHGQTFPGLISDFKELSSALYKDDELNVLFVNKITFTNPSEVKMLPKEDVRSSQHVKKLGKLECDLTSNTPRKTHDLCVKETESANTPIVISFREKDLVGETESDVDKQTATSMHSENEHSLSFSKVKEITNREIKNGDKLSVTVDDRIKTVHKNKDLEFSCSTKASISGEIKNVGKPHKNILTRPVTDPAFLLEDISKKQLPPLTSATSYPKVNSTNKTLLTDLTVTSQTKCSLESVSVFDRPKKSRRFDKKRSFLPCITKSVSRSLRKTKKEILLQGKSYSPLQKSKIDSVTKRNTRSDCSPQTVPATKNAILSNVQSIRYKSRFRVQLLPMGLLSDSLPDSTTNLKSDITVSTALPCKLSDGSRKMSHASDSDKNERNFENNARSRSSKFESNEQYSASMDSVLFSDSETNRKSFHNWKKKKINIKGHQVSQALKKNEKKKSDPLTLDEKTTFKIPLEWWT